MARQVYYDPFGQRVEGFRAGMQDMMALQDQTRRARASDYDFNVREPLRLQAAQRDESFAQYADPYRRRGLGMTERINEGQLFDAEDARLGRIGSRFGNYSPYAANMARYLTGDYYGSMPYQGAMSAYVDTLLNPSPENPVPSYMDQATEFGLDPQQYLQYLDRGTRYGQFSPEMQRGLDQEQNWDRINAAANQQHQYYVDEFGRIIQNTNANANALNAQTNAARQQVQAGGADPYGAILAEDFPGMDGF